MGFRCPSYRQCGTPATITGVGPVFHSDVLSLAHSGENFPVALQGRGHERGSVIVHLSCNEAFNLVVGDDRRLPIIVAAGQKSDTEAPLPFVAEQPLLEIGLDIQTMESVRPLKR